MSKTTLGSGASSHSHILYEEDPDASSPAQGQSSKNSTTKISADPEPERDPDPDSVSTRTETRTETEQTLPKSCSNAPKSKNTLLIEEFLTHYFRYGAPSCDLKSARRRKPATDANNMLTTHALVLDYETDRVEPPYEDLQAILSDILSLKVRYKIISPEVDDEKVSFFIVKTPPLSPEDRQLSTLAGADHREILFYTKTMPDIKNFIEKKKVDITLSIPQCFHAHYDRAMEESPVSGIIENLGRAESIIVLEDLRPQGFGKRHYVQPLSLAEVRTALREMARVHATTWAMAELSSMGEPLRKTWPFYYKPEYGAMLYEALLEDGLPRLEKHLREMVELNRDLTAAKILEHLGVFRSRGLRGILYRLLTPSKSPAPTCLVHMDFWSDNIFFRQADSDTDSAGDGTNFYERMADGASNEDGDSDLLLECQITDWQMFSIGRPTHDVALLLYTALDSKSRKDATDSMLDYYYKVFLNTADKFNLNVPFALQHIYEEYRRSQLWAVLQVIASIDLALSDDSTTERLLDAMLDLIHLKLL